MPRKLHEWEKDLSSRFLQVKLLGEIELNQAEFDDMAAKIRAFIRSKGTVQEATRGFEQYYPRTFATFLAHFAARNTNREFWDALGELVGASGSDLNNANWRNLFMRILKANGKRTFENVGGITNKYVTAIRIHGGIPAYSLDDFFKNMLKPAVDQDQYSGLSSVELRDALLGRSDVQIFTDSPVRNFFVNSGSIGLDFLNECVKMARAYKMDGETPSNLDLPAYVVEKFTTFMEQQVEFETKLKSPHLLFDPEGDGLVVELPQQQISAKDLCGNEQAVWQVSLEDPISTLQKRSRLAFSGRDIVSRADQIIIPKPVNRVRVTFGLQSHESLYILRRWSLHFLPEDNQPPLLAFNLRSDNFSSLMRLNQTLPPKTVLLLHPTDVELRFEGDAEKRHECNALSGVWSNWRADYWSLEKTWQVSLFRDGNEIGVFRVSTPAESPILVDGRLFGNTADPKGIPLYIGIPPCLRIPYRQGQQWQIHLESIWDTRPYICKDFTTSDLHLNENSLELDLGAILDQESAGTYLLGFTNHHDIEGEYRFRMWPRLHISDLPEAIFLAQESTETHKPIKFNLNLPVVAICEPQTGIDYLGVKGQYGHFSISVTNEDVTRADLNLILPAKDEMAAVSVPLFVPIPRLQWRFVLPGEESVRWTTTPLQKSVDSFLQAIQYNPVSVLIHIPRIETIASRLELVLMDPDHAEKVLQNFLPERPPLGDDYLRFPLNKGFDTLRAHSDAPVLTFELRFYDAEGLHARINLLSLTRALEISLVWLEHHHEYYTLHWQEPFPLRNRRIFLRPIWQPWNNGFEIKIPDEAHNELILKDMGLPHSHYEVFFYIAPSWQPEYSVPPDVRPHRFLTVDPTEQLRLLSKLISQHPERAFQAHFERACIYVDVGKIWDYNNEIAQCLEKHGQTKLRMLITFYNWVGKVNEDAQKSIWLKIFSPERLNELYSSIGSDRLSEMILQNTQNCMLPSQSVLALLRLTTDPQLILFCLRLLLEQHDSQGVYQIVEMIKNGHLSNSDALDLLSVEIEFCLPILGRDLHDSSYKCLFSDLIDDYNGKDAVISMLPVDSLLVLIASEQNTKTLRSYLELLIRRGESHGVDQIMELFQQGRLRGDEVTDLLGVNPEFSYKILSQSKLTQAHSAQLLELKRKYSVNFSGEIAVYPPTINQESLYMARENQLPHLIELIHKKDKQGIYQAWNLIAQGKINNEQLWKILEANPAFAYQTLLENPRVQQYQEQIITLARRFPLETGHFTPCMFIHTPAGWGRIEKIKNRQGEIFDIAHKDEPDLILELTLHMDSDPEKASLDLGNNKLIFEKVQEIYQCEICKEFFTSQQENMKKHLKNNHGGGHSCSRQPIIPALKPFQIRDDKTDKQKQIFISSTSQREPESLFIASLSNNQLVRMLSNSGSSKKTALACIATLIKRGQDDGLKHSFAFWRQRKINDNEALILLGLNPDTAYTYLDKLPSSQKPIQLLYALADQYPVETFNIKPGMFIKTPAGWGKIIHMQDGQGKTLDIAPVETHNLKIKLTLHSNINPETATADMNQGKLIFSANQTYKCDLCGACISANIKFISDTHTKSEHPGKKPVLSKQFSSIPFPRILEFSIELK